MAEFIRHTSCDNCGSSDGRAIYSDSSWYCFVCRETEPSKDSLKGKAPMEEQEKKSKPVITEEQKAEVKERAGYTSENYRGIRADTYKRFGVRHSVSDSDKLLAQYYPVTQDGELVGYKIRELPKHFGGSLGRTGSECDLFGQFMSKKSAGKFVIITEGEIDAMSAYQMINDYNKQKGWDVETPVVSPTIGSNCKKQIAGQYEFFKKFEKIYLSFDNDEAGQKVIDDLISVLPKGKVYVMKTRFKDANEFLKNGKEKEYIQDFWDAKQYVPAGVVASSDLYDRIVSQSELQKVTLPPFAKKLQEMLGGGFVLGHIYNIAAMSGIGKTSVVNEFIYHWIFHSPYTVGVVSMELNAGQYGEAMLSRHIQQKLARLTVDEKAQTLNTEFVKKKATELFFKEDDSPRFFLVDDRDGTVEQLKHTIEEMIIGSGVKLVVLDVLQDIMEGMTNEEQGLFMKWVKSMIKSHNVCFVLINHMRKKQDGTSTSKVDESDIHGSSTILKSASANILLTRDKGAEDEIKRNTTDVTLSKNRLLGDTGPAGRLYYDKMTHVMHDFDDYFVNGDTKEF